MRRFYGKLLVPPSGIFFGAEDQNNSFTGTNGIETVLGRTMAIRRAHYDWTDLGPAPMPTGFELATIARTNPHSIVMVCQHHGATFPVKFTSPKTGFGGSWPSKNTVSGAGGKIGIDRITAGEWDTQFTAQFNGLKALKEPVLYNLFYEFNGQGKSYSAPAQGDYGTELWKPASGELAYRDAYRHIRGLADACGATINHGGNIIFIWCQQGDTPFGYFENYYPGDDYVDWLGIDVYRRTLANALNNPAPGPGKADHLLYNFAKGAMPGSSAVGRGVTAKPVIICENGYTDGVGYVDTGTGSNGLTYYKDSSSYSTSIQSKLLADCKANPNIVACVTWNIDGDHHDIVNESPASLANYKTLVTDPYFGLYYNPSDPTPTPSPTETPTPTPSPTETPAPTPSATPTATPSPTVTPTPTPSATPSASPLPVEKNKTFGTDPDGSILQWDRYAHAGTAKRAAVLEIHGGRFRSGDKGNLSHGMATDVQNAGYLVLVPNYWLAALEGGVADENVRIPGQPYYFDYGSGSRRTGTNWDQVEDLRKAVVAARADPQCNGKVYGVGFSGGATWALILATTGTAGYDRLDGVVAISPPTDGSDVTGFKPPPPGAVLGFTDDWENLCALPLESPPRATSITTIRALSPAWQPIVPANVPGILIVIGDHEAMPVQQATDMVTHLTSGGVQAFTDWPTVSRFQRNIIPSTAHGLDNWTKPVAIGTTKTVSQETIDFLNSL